MAEGALACRAHGIGRGPDRGADPADPGRQPREDRLNGQNYHAHAEEQGKEAPKLPTFFAKFQNALALPGATVKLPEWSRVDYEAEVAFVVGGRAKDVAEADALDYIAGYTLLNDLSARDYQFKTLSGCPARSSTAWRPAVPRS